MATAATGIIPTPTVDERQARAAAGITMALGAVAFVYAAFRREYVPIRLVTTFFFVDFALRVGRGLGSSPVGVVARWLTVAQAPEPVAAAPKRFAWSLGLTLALAMTVITNARVTGLLPKTICLLCLSLMWLEAVLGVCLGCVVYRWLTTHGLLGRSRQRICPDGSCAAPTAPEPAERRVEPLRGTG